VTSRLVNKLFESDSEYDMTYSNPLYLRSHLLGTNRRKLWEIPCLARRFGR
jgi:hypothetical protein